MIVLRVCHGLFFPRAANIGSGQQAHKRVSRSSEKSCGAVRCKLRKRCRRGFVHRMVTRPFLSRGALLMAQDVTSELAPTGALRAGINLSLIHI